jgi:hypothetical protein
MVLAFMILPLDLLLVEAPVFDSEAAVAKAVSQW